MAILGSSTSSDSNIFAAPWQFEEACPTGPHVATCVDLEDQYGVTVPKYGAPGQTQVKDRTCFKFEIDVKGVKYGIASKWMNISSHEKASLVKFITNWQGEIPENFDTKTLKGKQAFISVSWQASNDGERNYANITSIMPVPEGYSVPAPVAASISMPEGAAEVVAEVVAESVINGTVTPPF